MENTAENNKLLAEFMGGEDRSKFVGGGNYFEFDKRQMAGATILKIFRYEELQYHLDWNWLMEVVEKIESLGYDSQILKNTCYFFDCDFQETKGNTKREAVYNACVKFIKWYNQQNK